MSFEEVYEKMRSVYRVVQNLVKIPEDGPNPKTKTNVCFCFGKRWQGGRNYYLMWSRMWLYACGLLRQMLKGLFRCQRSRQARVFLNHSRQRSSLMKGCRPRYKRHRTAASVEEVKTFDIIEDDGPGPYVGQSDPT